MRRLLAPLALLLAAAVATAAPRVVVLGFDGADPQVVAGMGATELPNLHRLQGLSGTSRLQTTTPAESPVAWASLITGLGPGDTGIYDFVYHARRAADGTPPPDFRVQPRYALLEKRTVPLLPAWQALLLAAAAGALTGLAAWGCCRRRRCRRRVALAVVLAFSLPAAGITAAMLLCWLPREQPAMAGRMTAVPFWDRAVAHGLRVRALTVPMTFPAGCSCAGDARILAGLGVPDVRGTSGTYQAWTTTVLREEERTFGGLLHPAARPGAAAQALAISGPSDLIRGGGARVELPFTVRARGGGRVSILLPGHPELALAPGEWSPPLELEFAMSPLLSVIGLARFHLVAWDGERFTLYLAPIGFHPEHVPPPIALSYPHAHAAELAAAIGGPYKTPGWAVDTWALADGVLGELAFAQDLRASFEERRRLLQHHLDQAADWDLLVAVFEDTDRAAHMLWRHLDPAHPLHDPALAGAGRERLLDTYRWADAVIGDVLARFAGDPECLILVVSDHGFASFRREVNLNTWLVEEGYLTLLPGIARGAAHRVGQLFGGAEVFAEVDWARTRAFALGLGTVYINVHGLDPQPSVAPSDAEPLAAEIAARLLTLEDGGTPVVSTVAVKRRAGPGHRLFDSATGRDLGSWGRDAPELVVGFAPGYRVSWQTALGGIPAAVLADNLNPWSGDHCSVNPADVPGILAANRPLVADPPPGVLDLAPTILQWLRVPVVPPLPGRSLLPGE